MGLPGREALGLGWAPAAPLMWGFGELRQTSCSQKQPLKELAWLGALVKDVEGVTGWVGDKPGAIAGFGQNSCRIQWLLHHLYYTIYYSYLRSYWRYYLLKM